MYLAADVEWIDRTIIFDEVSVLEKIKITSRKIAEEDLAELIEALKEIDEKKVERLTYFS